jgi:hypothetical protein
VNRNSRAAGFYGIHETGAWAPVFDIMVTIRTFGKELGI